MRSLFTNISIAVVLNALVKPLSLLLENVAQDRIGHADWGMYSGLQSWGFILLILCDFGLNQFTTQRLASKPEALHENYPYLFGLKITLSLLYPALMLGLGYLWGFDARELYYLFWLSLIQAAMQLLAFFRANFQAAQAFKTDSFASVFDRILLMLGVGVLLHTGMNLESFVWLRVLVVMLTLALFYVLLVRQQGGIQLPKWDKKHSPELLKGSFSFAMVMFLYSMNEKIDQVMIRELVGNDENGLYAGAYRWLEAISMYQWTVLPIFFARFAASVNDNEKLPPLLQFGQYINALPMLLVCSCLVWQGDLLLFLFKSSTPAQIETIRYCLQVLMAALGFGAIFSILSTLLTATHHEKFVNVLIILGIAVNVGWNAVFVPEYGARAAAWGTFANYAFLSLAYLVYLFLRPELRALALLARKQSLQLILLYAVSLFTFWGLGQIWDNALFVITAGTILYLLYSFPLIRILLKARTQ